MRWAVVGDTGLFGSEMAQLLEDRGEEVLRFNRSNLDLEESSESIARLVGPADVVVNSVGYTQVDRAEQDLYEANTVNGIYAGKLAEVAALLGAKYFYISTDYVFDGEANSAYSVTAGTNPLNVYGKSKELGEQLVADSGANYTIFRTSWLYGSHGICFPKSIAKRISGGEELEIVDDQIGSPTWTKDLAKVIYEHGTKELHERIVHAVSSGSTSWFQFSNAIASSLGVDWKLAIKPVSSEHFVAAALRPKYSVLDNSETQGPIIDGWEDRWFAAAPEVLAEFLAK